MGTRNIASVSEPITVPVSSLAKNSAVAGDATISASSAAVGAGDDEESWGISPANAATRSSLTS